MIASPANFCGLDRIRLIVYLPPHQYWWGFVYKKDRMDWWGAWLFYFKFGKN